MTAINLADRDSPRGEARIARGSIDAAPPGSGALMMSDAAVVAAWCRRYGVTVDQLSAATTMVGLMPAALHFYLTSRGRPTKVVTEEMRASRTPLRPRDRRRKTTHDEAAEPDARALELVRLRDECSLLERDLHAITDSLHAQLRPSTLHAYDAAQRRLDETMAKLEAAERAATMASKQRMP